MKGFSLAALSLLLAWTAQAAPDSTNNQNCFVKAKVVSAIEGQSSVYAEGVTQCFEGDKVVFQEATSFTLPLRDAADSSMPVGTEVSFQVPEPDSQASVARLSELKDDKLSWSQYGGYYRGGAAYRGGYYRGGAVYRGGYYRGGAVYRGGAYYGRAYYPAYRRAYYPTYYRRVAYPAYNGGYTYPTYYGETTYPSSTTYQYVDDPGYQECDCSNVGTSTPEYYGDTSYPVYYGGSTYPTYYGGAAYRGGVVYRGGGYYRGGDFYRNRPTVNPLGGYRRY